MSDLDDELDRAREQSQVRFRSAFESIFAKYGHIDEDDDIIDLETGELLVDNGRMRNTKPIALGDLHYATDTDSREQTSSNGDSSGSDEDLDSMTSLGAGGGEPGGASGDVYFTTSIEQYLERLRQQMAGAEGGWEFGAPASSPRTMSSAELAADRAGSRVSVSESSAEENGGISEEEPIEAYEIRRRTLQQQFGAPLARLEPQLDRVALASPERVTRQSELFALQSEPFKSPDQFALQTELDRRSESFRARSGPFMPLEPSRTRVERYRLPEHWQPEAFRPQKLVRPQPVAPHVFFDQPAYPNEDGYYYDGDDDNASIHSGESMHSDRAYDLQLTDTVQATSNYYFGQ
ncbi:hypothetical protein LPJ63_003322 [Coemansia sp. RSA 2711]|nr:hypothetical protein LPJ63_003322 [Coemansia sp. RSA 2711]